jgi:hypothetical protein
VEGAHTLGELTCLTCGWQIDIRPAVMAKIGGRAWSVVEYNALAEQLLPDPVTSASAREEIGSTAELELITGYRPPPPFAGIKPRGTPPFDAALKFFRRNI